MTPPRLMSRIAASMSGADSIVLTAFSTDGTGPMSTAPRLSSAWQRLMATVYSSSTMRMRRSRSFDTAIAGAMLQLVDHHLKALLALTQARLGLGALDQIGGLSRQHVEQIEIAFLRAVRLAPL